MEHHLVLNFDEDSIQELRSFLDKGGKRVTLGTSAPQGRPPLDFPEDVLVSDYRYGGVSHIRGVHPRLEGFWTAYSGLTTGLARNVTYSQTITDETPIEDSRSQPYEMQRAPAGFLSSEEYRHLHNHHQLLHAEVFNFSKDLNGVALWGDSAALAPGARSWGAFFSARSWPVKWGGYTPAALYDYNPETEFDASLVGVEIDVINGGKDCGVLLENVGYSCAKIGLQVVGFGQRNTAAIEIRTEDTDDPSKTSKDRRGAWRWGIIMRNSLHEDSSVLCSDNGNVYRGIDFDNTVCRDGALRISGNGENSGIVFDRGASGQIYSEDKTMNLRVGQSGIKIWNSTGTEVLMEVTDDGVRVYKFASEN